MKAKNPSNIQREGNSYRVRVQSNGVIVKPFGPEFLDTIESAELDSDDSFGSTETA